MPVSSTSTTIFRKRHYNDCAAPNDQLYPSPLYTGDSLLKAAQEGAVAHTATAAEIMSQKVEKKHWDDSFCNAEKVHTLISKFMPRGSRGHGAEEEEADFKCKARDCALHLQTRHGTQKPC